MLDVQSTREKRVARSFTLRPSTLKLLDQLAIHYGSNNSRVVEAMILQFGPRILKPGTTEGGDR